MIPNTLVLKPGLAVHKIYNGTGFGGVRPSPNFGKTCAPSQAGFVQTGTSASRNSVKPRTFQISTGGTSTPDHDQPQFKWRRRCVFSDACLRRASSRNLLAEWVESHGSF
jgi:hypothetical protein